MRPSTNFSSFQTFPTIFHNKKQQTSARFELGSLEQKVSTLTTWPRLTTPTIAIVPIQMINIKVCQGLDSNRGPLVLVATALPTEPQPQPYLVDVCDVAWGPLHVKCCRNRMTRQFCNHQKVDGIAPFKKNMYGCHYAFVKIVYKSQADCHLIQPTSIIA